MKPYPSLGASSGMDDDDKEREVKAIEEAGDLMREFMTIRSAEDCQMIIDWCKRLAARERRLD